MAESENGEKVLGIRKYPNRRYYDSTRSRHVTLEDIHAAIRDGHEIRVVDSKTEQDITARVLAQIIIEFDPPKLDVFPVPLLHGILRANQKMIGDFITRYFNQPLGAYLDSQRHMEQMLRNAMGIPSHAPTLADMTRAMLGTIGAPPAAPAGANKEAEVREKLEQLREQVLDLQARLKRKKGRSKSKR